MVFREYFTTEHIDVNAIPPELRISSISSHIRLGTTIKLQNVFDSLKGLLDENDIGSITYGNQECKVIEKKKKKKRSKQFQNSISVDILVNLPDGLYPNSVNRQSRVNMKIFSNGTIQMSGCRNPYDGNTALNRLITRLEKQYLIIDGVSRQPKIVRLIDGPIEVHDLSINMINADLKLDYKVNREDLYEHLLERKIQCKYNKINHAPVDLQFPVESKDKPIHIYFFQSGSVIITGSQNHHHINDAYSYMNEIIEPIKDDIRKIDDDVMTKLALDDKYAHLMMN